MHQLRVNVFAIAHDGAPVLKIRTRALALPWSILAHAIGYSILFVLALVARSPLGAR